MDAYQDDAIQRWHVQRADSVAEAREWIAAWRGGWAAETGCTDQVALRQMPDDLPELGHRFCSHGGLRRAAWAKW